MSFDDVRLRRRAARRVKVLPVGVVGVAVVSEADGVMGDVAVVVSVVDVGNEMDEGEGEGDVGG